MVIHIVESRQVGGRWFYSGQEYTYLNSRFMQTYNCDACVNKSKVQWEKVYETLISDVLYELPEIMCAILTKDEPDPDTRSDFQRLTDRRLVDPAACYTDGHTDVVKQAEIFLGVRMTNGVEVDQSRLNILRHGKED